MTGVFVTGTDTGVGKTAVAAGLAAHLVDEGVRVRPVKPVETGWPEEADWPLDAACLAQAAKLGDLDREAVVPQAYREPLAPSVAADRAGDPVDLGRLDRAVQAAREDARLTIVEGAGGLLVPVTEDRDMADLAARWELPLLVVARSGLGTLNHTALTVEHAHARGLDVLGVVLNRWLADPDVATRTNPDELDRMLDVPVLGRVPDLDVSTDEARIDGLAEAVAELNLTPITDRIERSSPHASKR